eukprot:gene14956-20119_t
MEFVNGNSKNGSNDVQSLIDQRALLHGERINYRPKQPQILKGLFDVKFEGPTECLNDKDAIQTLFPTTFGQPRCTLTTRSGLEPISPFMGRKFKIGAVFSGGPAPGGHNVLTGMLDFLKRRNSASELIGFIGGPSGIVDKKYKVITEQEINHFRNVGGFHFLGSGRTKIESEQQLQSSLQTCVDLDLDGVVIIGGDDSNTNAGILAEYFKRNNCKTCVVGVPKTIDGDLRNDDIEASFGFDTATKVYSNMVANLEFDAISALKAYHFVRVMGRDASHITLEVALQTHPNLLFISEEVENSGLVSGKAVTLLDIVDQICALVVERSKIKKNYGVILIPEGLVGFVPDMKQLIAELNEILAHVDGPMDPTIFDSSNLTANSKLLYQSLPEFFLRQMMAERDPHGNVQVAAIETERLLASMTKAKLEQLHSDGSYNGKFNSITHYFGYEGRCALPSQFDCDYCYTLGATAAALLESNLTGYIASVRNLSEPAHLWSVGGSPLTSMMNIERRHGKNKPVIKKKLVDLQGAPFLALQKVRKLWMVDDDYRMPGSIQHSGGTADHRNLTLLLEAESKGKTIVTDLYI